MSDPDRSAAGVRVSVVANEKAPTGERIEFDGMIDSFELEDTEKKADKMSLVLDNTKLALFDCAPLMSGAMLEVTWGYPGLTAPPRRVVVQHIKGFQKLKIEALATSVDMAKLPKTKSWHGKKHSDVIEEVARANGYEGDFVHIEDTKIIIDTISQRAESDAAFVRRLANKEGYQFYVDDTGLHFHKRNQGTAPTHTFEWFGPGIGDIIAIDCDADLLRRTGAVQVVGKDPLTKKPINVTADGSNTDRDKLGAAPVVIRRVDERTGETSTSTLATPAAPQSSQDPEATGGGAGGSLGGILGLFGGSSASADARAATANQRATSAKTEEQAKREAAARFTGSERAAIKLTVTVWGDPTIRAKEVVEMKGIGAMLSGRYYVTEAKHSISSGEYKTTMKLTKDGRGGGVGALSKPKPTDAGKQNTQDQGAAGTKEPIRMVDERTGETRLQWKGGRGSPDPEGK